jgi:protein-S-isoprenylcysteine O-methyltransferase Ste14
VISSNGKRRLETALVVLINLGFLIAINSFFWQWEQVKSPLLVVLYLFITSSFCAIESWSAASKNECFSKCVSTIDVSLCQITGLFLLSIFVVSLCEKTLAGSPPNIVMNVIGTALAALGILLRYLAFRGLNQAFTSLPHIAIDQELVIDGIYKLARHPSETGLYCISLGLPIMMESAYGLIIFGVLMLPTSYIRLTREEAFLVETYGRDYTNYKAAVPSLIPYPSTFKT